VIIDTSAIMAIVKDEPEAEAFATMLAGSPVNRISAATLVETSIVIDRSLPPSAHKRLDALLDGTAIVIESVTAEHADLARTAHRRFGRGSGHPARLNFGDCFAYALAKATGESLLYKGDGFGHTDIRSALE
jgi:ribonuclease VapC